MQNENTTTGQPPITPEHLNALVTLAITSGDDDTAAKSLAALVTEVASIPNHQEREELTLRLIERVYTFTNEYCEAIEDLAQLEKFKHRKGR